MDTGKTTKNDAAEYNKVMKERKDEGRRTLAKRTVPHNGQTVSLNCIKGTKRAHTNERFAKVKDIFHDSGCRTRASTQLLSTNRPLAGPYDEYH